MKKILLLAIFLVVLILIFNGFDLIKFDEGPRYMNRVTNTSRPIEVVEKQKKTSEHCSGLREKFDLKKLEKVSDLVWENIHIRYTDGEVYRIRYFFDDGPNGQYKKTILYKEGVDNFPHIVETFQGFEKEKLKSYFEDGEIIWKELAFSHSDNGLFWRNVNGELKEVSFNDQKCRY
jgi:hypothetical protein